MCNIPFLNLDKLKNYVDVIGHTTAIISLDPAPVYRVTLDTNTQPPPEITRAPQSSSPKCEQFYRKLNIALS